MIKSSLDKATGFEKRFENIDTIVFEDSTSASKAVAKEMADLIKVKQAQKQPCILGLATGSSPKGLYAELVRLHKEDGLSFKNVISFNLDEYYPIEPDSINSYVRFMKEQLFNHVDILQENCHIPERTRCPGWAGTRTASPPGDRSASRSWSSGRHLARS